MLGVNPLIEPWTAWQLRSAVYTFGSWFDMQRSATKEAPMPDTKRKPTMTVPKYSTDELRAMLGIGPSADASFLVKDVDADRKAAELNAAFNSGDIDWRTMLGITS
jgi:hypothetical protein